MALSLPPFSWQEPILVGRRQSLQTSVFWRELAAEMRGDRGRRRRKTRQLRVQSTHVKAQQAHLHLVDTEASSLLDRQPWLTSRLGGPLKNEHGAGRVREALNHPVDRLSSHAVKLESCDEFPPFLGVCIEEMLDFLYTGTIVRGQLRYFVLTHSYHGLILLLRYAQGMAIRSPSVMGARS